MVPAIVSRRLYINEHALFEQSAGYVQRGGHRSHLLRVLHDVRGDRFRHPLQGVGQYELTRHAVHSRWLWGYHHGDLPPAYLQRCKHFTGFHHSDVPENQRFIKVPSSIVEQSSRCQQQRYRVNRQVKLISLGFDRIVIKCF